MTNTYTQVMPAAALVERLNMKGIIWQRITGMQSACVAPAADILHTRCYVQSSIFIAETQDG